MVAWVLLAFESADGTAVPAAGAGGTMTLAGAGVAAWRCGGLGMVSGPVWPQAVSSDSVARAIGSANEDFTIRITV